MAIYPDVIFEIKKACNAYKNRTIDVISLQRILARSVDSIVSIEEKKLRQFLDDAENRIELVQYTVNSNRFREEVIAIVESIEAEIRRWE